MTTSIVVAGTTASSALLAAGSSGDSCFGLDRDKCGRYLGASRIRSSDSFGDKFWRSLSSEDSRFVLEARSSCARTPTCALSLFSIYRSLQEATHRHYPVLRRPIEEVLAEAERLKVNEVPPLLAAHSSAHRYCTGSFYCSCRIFANIFRLVLHFSLHAPFYSSASCYLFSFHKSNISRCRRCRLPRSRTLHGECFQLCSRV